MKDRKLASNYAGALLSLINDNGEAERVNAFLSGLAKAVDGTADLRDLMRDPATPRDLRRKVLTAAAQQQGLSKNVQNFMNVVVDHNRTDQLSGIASEFHRQLEERMGVVPVELTTAKPMSDDLLQRARQALEKNTGKRIRLTCKVDESLIGGAVARMGSRIYDGSLKTQLTQLRSRMVQG